MRSLRLVKYGCAVLFIVMALLSVTVWTISYEHQTSVEAALTKEQELKSQLEVSCSLQTLRTSAIALLEGRRNAENGFFTVCNILASISGVLALNFAGYWFFLSRAEREIRKA